MISTAQPIIDKLHQLVTESGFIVLLADDEGYVIDIAGDKSTLTRAVHLNLYLGGNWQEREVGTNGLGTALALNHPVQISGAEHYCDKLRGWTCSAAPIRDLTGHIVGALQMSGPCSRAHLHTLGMVVAAVEAIQGYLDIEEKSHRLTVLNNHLNSIFFSVSDGVLLINQQAEIQEVNPVAEKILAYPAAKICGQRITRFLDLKPHALETLGKGSPLASAETAFYGKHDPAYCRLSAKPLKDEQNNILGNILFLKPIDEIKNPANRYTAVPANFHFSDIIGQNERLQTAIKLALLAAKNDANVLLQGESGTGKEVFAQAIHNHSSRHTGPFVAINCGAIPHELLASELFGYEEGAFTGAGRGGRPGKFELASGGTLFLDEIGEMPLEQQITLLRVLQDQKITRLGSSKVISTDVRILCATNKNLKEEVKKGSFRQDLYYRLNVIFLQLPPLRERKDDIPLLFSTFQTAVCRKSGITLQSIERNILEHLRAYEWPGNIRELQNVVERMIYSTPNGVLSTELLPQEILTVAASAERKSHSDPKQPLKMKMLRQQFRQSFAEHERQEILTLLSREVGNVSAVARTLGISRSALYRKMHQFKLL
ncbi:sigma-54-dependent Fis family transcriptional regulator [Acididesulfobacillus acetoxydans]|uniref:sigma-54-dependent Fis family transcriptional regulator n=1 Tax=Acididesulfobacillus acetoxydans TaxID=1561005 RepID=UPI0021BECB88|nr:sigma-54-dependent Fis family transcriptional regulator [Acididesulfobacillus acetoxydans]